MKSFITTLLVSAFLVIAAPASAAAQVSTEDQVSKLMSLLTELQAELTALSSSTFISASKLEGQLPELHCKLKRGQSQHGITSDGKYFYLLEKTNQSLLKMNKETCRVVKTYKKVLAGTGITYNNGYFYTIADPSEEGSTKQFSVYKYNHSLRLVSEYAYRTTDPELSELGISGISFDEATGRLHVITNGSNDAIYSIGLGTDIKRERYSPGIASAGIAETSTHLFISVGENSITTFNKATGVQDTIAKGAFGTDPYLSALYYDSIERALYVVDNNADKLYSVQLN